MSNIGRPKIYGSDKEREAARKERNSAYQREYLRVRRERYQNDAEYRKRVTERERDAYRGRRPDFKPKGFGSKAGSASRFASAYRVTKGKRVVEMDALSVPQMAEFVGVIPKVLNGWIVEGKFPRPPLNDESGLRVFPVDLANQYASLLKSGLKGRAAFRNTDKDLILELHAAGSRFRG